MLTHYLGQEQVRAYLRDLADRFIALGAQRPRVWTPIGPSGSILAAEFLRVCPEFQEDTALIPVQYDRDTRGVVFESAAGAEGQPLLVLDSSVHSGQTMLRVVREAQTELRPSSITTYTLILKRSSQFVPTYWGVMIDDHDRAYFLLDRLPNNRLNPQAPQSHLRLMTEADLGAPRVPSGVEALDKISWEDRWYDMRNSDRERRTYLLEVGTTVVGYITFVRTQTANGRDGLMIDEVVVGKDHQGQHHGSSLMRWAETMARHMRCSEVRLWAIDDQVDFYKRLKYDPVQNERPMVLDGHPYSLMAKRVIYHV